MEITNNNKYRGFSRKRSIGYGTPDIFNTDQGSQFTSHQYIDALKQYNIQIPMDGKGRWLDNVFIERL